MAALQRALPVMSAEPPCICPLTLEPPKEPVTTPCGHTFERAALEMHRTVTHAGGTLCQDTQHDRGLGADAPAGGSGGGGDADLPRGGLCSLARSAWPR
ncbi:hypothetical protein T492DRAFT_955281 [Pavlovales sp. CCMP2436]|nr:hypothetical protein T492DRAFT_955281 [Pavlovales sp. CCMP2436]